MNRYLLLLIIAQLFMTCSAELPEGSVAVIGREVLTKENFFEWIHPRHFEKLSEASKRDTLEYFINLNVVLKEMEERGADKDASLVRQLYQWKKERLVHRVFQEEVVQKMYSEENLRKLYEELQLLRDVNLIRLTFGKIRSRNAAFQSAWEIYQQSRQMDFVTLAKKYSDIPKHRETGGEAVFSRKFTAITTPLDSAVWNTGIGKISKPFRNANEYVILRVNKEYKEDNLSTFEDSRSFVEEIAPLAYKEKIADFGVAYLDSLRRSANYALDPAGVRLFIKKFTEFLELPSNAHMRNNPLEIVNSIQEPIHLGSFAGRKLDNNWLIQKISEEGEVATAIFTSELGMGAWINKTVDTDLQMMRARELGFDQIAGYQILFKRFKLKASFKHYVANLLLPQIEPAEEEIEAYYEAHKYEEKYLTRPQARVQVIRSLDKDIAETVYARAKKGENFTDLAKKYHQTNGAFKNSEGFLPTLFQNEYGPIGEAASKMVLNEIHEPIQFGDSYVVVKVLEKIAAVPKFLPEVKEAIRSDILMTRLKEVEGIELKRLRKKYGAKLNEKFLASYSSSQEITVIRN